MPAREFWNILDEVRTLSKAYPLSGGEATLADLERIQATPQMVQFFERLRNDVTLRQVFWTQPQLVSPLHPLPVPLLFLETPMQSSLEPLQYDAARAEAEIDSHFAEIMQRFLPDIMQRLSNLAPKIEQDIQAAKAADPKAPDNEIQGNILKQHFMNEMFPEISDERVNYLLEASLRRAGDIAVPIIYSLLTMGKLKALEYGRAHSEKLIRSARISQNSLESVARFLAKGCKTSAPALSVMFCPQCLTEVNSFVVMGHREIPIASCATCRSGLNSGTFYYLHPELNRIFFRQDGFVHYTVAWSLAKGAAAEWRPNSYLEADDGEKDIVFKMKNGPDYSIVECKTYNTDSTDRTMEANVNRDLKQLDEQLRSFLARGISVERICLVSNLPDTILQKMPEELRKKGFSSDLRKRAEFYNAINYGEFDKQVRKSVEE